ncbi:hypothetical protein BGZ92_006370 [Podila epicladia]|nr:hypothetical protein BGZ92_006370 [Podila epicladia]
MASTSALLEFKAGRCFRQEGTNTVKPDPAKGLVYVEEQDELLHFFWKNRTTGEVEDDLILFPGDAEMVPVPHCTTGRVLMLQFKSSSQKLFYWLQERKTDRDEVILYQVNSLIQQSAEDDEDDIQMEEDVNMETEETPAAPIAPSAAFAPANPGSSSSGGGKALTSQQMDQLRNVLAGIQVPQAAPRSNLRLDHVLTPGSIAPLLNNPAICAALFPHLPESAERTPEEIQAIVRTPQFSQALVSLSTALESGQLGPLLRQFGLGANAGAGVEGFLAAIEEQAKNDQAKK